MTIEPGTNLLHYRIVEKIGEGGMGVVWRAEDTKLSRSVAIKVLPPEFAEDQQRLARFEREAKLLAALNHSNVASIHGFENAGGVHFLVLELIDGLTLSQMTKNGPLPVEEALDVGRQVAEGLEAAHDAGVIHRDLKPGNVIVSADGKAKVLDFGLAKGIEGTASGESGSDLSRSPTVTSGGTQAGIVLGTPPYMSPEQARGKRLDKRTDIWSFGCLLYECLTGKLTFSGETVTDTLSAILQNDPDWDALPPRTPPRVRYLLERCLEKNPRNRLHDISDARIELDKSLSAKEWTTSGIRAAETLARAGPFSSRVIALGGILVLVAGLIIGAMLPDLSRSSSEVRTPPAITRVSINPPRELLVPGLQSFGISPDGGTVTFSAFERSASSAERTRRLYTRRLDRLGAEPVRGSAGFSRFAWSPDGRWLAMVVPVTPASSKRQLVKLPVDGSAPPVKIADWPENMSPGLLWLPGGDLVAPTHKPYRLLRFPSDGGPPKLPVEIDSGDRGVIFFWPLQPLPDDRHVLAIADTNVRGRYQLDLLLLDVESGELKLLVEDAVGYWLPSGHLVFNRLDTLLAVPFDLESLELTGGPVAILDGLRLCYEDLYACWGVAANGTLLYAPTEEGRTSRRIVYLTRDGDVEPWSEDSGLFSGVSVSRDGERMAVGVLTKGHTWWETWVSEVDRPRLRPLLVEPSMDCSIGGWSPEGDRIAYSCWGPGTAGGIYLRRWDGTDEPEILMERSDENVRLFPTSFSPDGSTLLIRRRSDGRSETLMLPLTPATDGSREPRVLLPRESNPSTALFSADGRWIAYASDETGRSEVYVRTTTPEGELGPRILVSTDGGTAPRLAPSREGPSQELFYTQGRQLMVVSVTSAPTLAVGEPTPVLDLSLVREQSHAHLPDGRILLVQGSEEERELKELHVILNFQEEIKRKLAEAE